MLGVYMTMVKKSKAGRKKAQLPKEYVYTTRLNKYKAAFIDDLCEKYSKSPAEVLRGAVEMMYADRKHISSKLHWHTVEEESEAGEVIE
jgi:hypothetical protein